MTGGIRWLFVALLLSVASVPSSAAGSTPPHEQTRERPATVVVSVDDDGFHWTDAGLGAAAMFATTLLALGVVLALRPERESTAKPLGAPGSAKGDEIYE